MANSHAQVLGSVDGLSANIGHELRAKPINRESSTCQKYATSTLQLYLRLLFPFPTDVYRNIGNCARAHSQHSLTNVAFSTKEGSTHGDRS